MHLPAGLFEMPALSTALKATAISVAVLLAGCARELPPRQIAARASVEPPAKPQSKIVTGSIVKAEPNPVVPAEVAPAPEAAIIGSAAWCAQRHIDAAEGRAPGGATVLAQKEAHDGICEQQRGISGNQ
jgi:hypothetical protein